MKKLVLFSLVFILAFASFGPSFASAQESVKSNKDNIESNITYEDITYILTKNPDNFDDVRAELIRGGNQTNFLGAGWVIKKTIITAIRYGGTSLGMLI